MGKSMSRKKRVVLSVFVCFIVNSNFCMDEPPKDPEKPSQTPSIYPQISASSSGLSGLSLSSSSSNQSWFSFNPVSAVTGFFSSVATTAHNKLSDDAALKKIGYPAQDIHAQDQLRECQKLYKDLGETKDGDMRKVLLERALRRTEYLTRIFCMLPDRPDARDIVLLCIGEHKNVMNEALKDLFPAFLHAQAQAYAVASEQIKQSAENNHINQVQEIPQAGFSEQTIIAIPTPGVVLGYLFDGMSSAYETAKNELSDYEAFKKLGWPLSDFSARQEIIPNGSMYENVALLKDRQILKDTLYRILRRTKILVRAFLSLPSRSYDKCQFAAHCITHHKPAMFPLLLILFQKFIEEERMAAQIASKSILHSSDLHIVCDGQAMLHFGKIDEQEKNIQDKLGLTHLILLKQVHEIAGCVISENNRTMQESSVEGDFLVTNQKNIGLGIRTADCLPIIFVDEKHEAIGIAHAGWLGSVNNIVKAVFDCMCQEYGTTVNDVSITFGPCAHKCCYQVKEDFLPQVDDAKFSFAKETIAKRGDDYFFDLPLFNKKLVLSLGVSEGAIHEQFSKCTICNHDYYSYRRQGDDAGRQISCVWVK